MKAKFTLLIAVTILFVVNANCQTMASRLTGITDRSYNVTTYAISDSTVYFYSNGRGAYNKYGLPFDSCHSYTYNTSSYTNHILTMQTFDSHNNALSKTVQTWNAVSSSWKNTSRVLSTYDANGNQLTAKNQVWDSASSSWTGAAFSNNFIITYDANNNILTEIQQDWDIPSATYINTARFANTYNSSGNKISALFQNWNTVSSSWVNNSLDTFRYDASGNDITDSSLSWSTATSTWNNYYYEVYTYNSSNKVILDLYQQWYLGAWINSEEKILTYDASNRLQTDSWLNWSSGTSAWLNYINFIYGYDASGNDTLSISQDPSGSTWVNSERTISSFNSYNQVLLSTNTEWNTGSSLWVPIKWGQQNQLLL